MRDDMAVLAGTARPSAQPWEPFHPLAVEFLTALSAIAGLPAGVMGVYISVNTLCDMGATCCNVLGDLACSVAMKETAKPKKK